MKAIGSISALALLTFAATSRAATSYNDPGGVGDFTGGSGFMDISSVTVDNDANNLIFTINLGGDPTTASWANYLVGIVHPAMNASGGNLNGPGGWGTDIQMSVGGMDYFIGAYPYWGSSQILTWNGASWITASGNASGETTSSASFTVPLAALGLSAGNTIHFDVWSQSSGNSVLDALSDGVARSWNNNPFDTGQNALSYTVVPEPGICAMLGLGSLLLIRRVRSGKR